MKPAIHNPQSHGYGLQRYTDAAIIAAAGGLLYAGQFMREVELGEGRFRCDAADDNEPIDPLREADG